MASEIKTNSFAGGAGLHPSGNGEPHLAGSLRDAVDDVTELRTQFIALLAKLDGDVGITDVDYESTLTPAAQTLTKG